MIRLSKLPIRRGNIVTSDCPSIARGDTDGQALTVEVGVALPVLTPVYSHSLPAGPRTLDRHRLDVSGPTNVGDEHQVEVRVPVDREPYPTLLSTWYPPVGNWDDSCSVLSDLQESGLGHVEMLAGRVAPSSVVVGQRWVGRAKVGSRDGDAARQARLAARATQFEARTAAQPVVEQSSA